ncbi:hypothetical protein MMC22_003132 [Lobaria immixta]|nr:hypothetical protein [Lobaria immixta]
MPLAQFNNPLEASSYFHLTANSAYGALRDKTVEIASLMGYDYDSQKSASTDPRIKTPTTTSRIPPTHDMRRRGICAEESGQC